MSPPSVNNNNMLHVERDSKHRRLTTSLGLTFRNNNWSDSTKININLKDQKFFKYLLMFIAACLFLLTLTIYTPLGALLSENPLIFYIWSVIDNKTMWVASILWCLRTLLNLVIHWYMAQIMKKIFKLDNTNESFWDYTFFTKQSTTKKHTTYFDPSLLSKKHILYSWLKNNNTNKSQKLLENIYDSTHVTKMTTNHYTLFNILFNQTGLLTLNTYNYLLLKQQLNTLHIENNFKFDNYAVRYANNDNFYKLVLSYNPIKILNKNQKFNHNYINLIDNMTLNRINTECLKHPLQINNKTGLFYLPKLNQSILNTNLFSIKELFTLTNSLNEQKTLNNWTIWFYKNSSISRDFLRFSHKITNAKKLISSGFWDSKSTIENLWSSELDKTLINPKSFYNAIYFNTYANLKNNNNIQSLIKLSTNYTNNSSSGFLNHYNPSLFWITKRLYMFNNSQEININSMSIMKSKQPFMFNQKTNIIKNENFLIQNIGLQNLNIKKQPTATIPKNLLRNWNPTFSNNHEIAHLRNSLDNISWFWQSNTPNNSNSILPAHNFYTELTKQEPVVICELDESIDIKLDYWSKLFIPLPNIEHFPNTEHLWGSKSDVNPGLQWFISHTIPKTWCNTIYGDTFLQSRVPYIKPKNQSWKIYYYRQILDYYKFSNFQFYIYVYFNIKYRLFGPRLVASYQTLPIFYPLQLQLPQNLLNTYINIGKKYMLHLNNNELKLLKEFNNYTLYKKYMLHLSNNELKLLKEFNNYTLYKNWIESLKNQPFNYDNLKFLINITTFNECNTSLNSKHYLSHYLNLKNTNSTFLKKFNNDTHYEISTEFCNNWLLNYDDLESLINITTKKLNKSLQLEYYSLRYSNLKFLGDISIKKTKRKTLLKSEERKKVNKKQIKKLTNYSKFNRFYF